MLSYEAIQAFVFQEARALDERAPRGVLREGLVHDGVKGLSVALAQEGHQHAEVVGDGPPVVAHEQRRARRVENPLRSSTARSDFEIDAARPPLRVTSAAS